MTNLDLYKAFGKNVSDRRRELGLSQEKLGEMAGLHRTYVGAIERGERNVSLANIVRIAAALEVEPATLLDGVHRCPPTME